MVLKEYEEKDMFVTSLNLSLFPLSYLMRKSKSNFIKIVFQFLIQIYRIIISIMKHLLTAIIMIKNNWKDIDRESWRSIGKENEIDV